MRNLLYFLYQLSLTALFYLSLPLLLLWVWCTGKHREGLCQRLGLYRNLPKRSNGPRIWLHAASVGEVKASSVLIEMLKTKVSDADFVVTTMTLHGRNVAREQLGNDVHCMLAPLDVPGIVEYVIGTINPQMYICIETELWPILLRRLKKRNVPLVLANGRMSERAFLRYKKRQNFFSQVINNFDILCMISERDKDRYLALGGNLEKITVSGNVKYDLELPAGWETYAQDYRKLLRVDLNQEIFVSGSTHTGEEEILLPVVQALSHKKSLLWIIAPRHLTRIPAIKELLEKHCVQFELLSTIKLTGIRNGDVILLDSFGELAGLYSVGTYVFCGGSLVERNGHNLLEAAVWNKAVMFGPSMGDFLDAVDLLEDAQAGFCVENGADIMRCISQFREEPDLYRKACKRAGQVARSQQGAAERQVEKILSVFS